MPLNTRGSSKPGDRIICPRALVKLGWRGIANFCLKGVMIWPIGCRGKEALFTGKNLHKPDCCHNNLIFIPYFSHSSFLLDQLRVFGMPYLASWTQNFFGLLYDRPFLFPVWNLLAAYFCSFCMVAKAPAK